MDAMLFGYTLEDFENNTTQQNQQQTNKTLDKSEHPFPYLNPSQQTYLKPIWIQIEGLGQPSAHTNNT